MLNHSRTLTVIAICFLCQLANTQEAIVISQDETAESVIAILKKYKLGSDNKITADNVTLASIKKLYGITSYIHVQDEFPRNAFIEILKSKSNAFAIAKKESANWWISAVNESKILSNADLLALTSMSRLLESSPIIAIDVPLEEKTTR